MAANREQLDRADHGRSALWRKQAKRQMNKLHRRLAKRDCEDAPRIRKYRGYET